MLYLVDSEQSQILGCAQLTYSVTFKIKDLETFPNAIYKFVTCGHQHIAIWSLKGGILSYCSLEIENPEDVIEIQDLNSSSSNSPDKLTVTFITVIFVNETIITAGDDGYLYVWDNNKIIKK